MVYNNFYENLKTLSDLYVIFGFLKRFALFNATSATSGFCVNVKDVAYGNASFLLTITASVKDKATKKIDLCHFFR